MDFVSGIIAYLLIWWLVLFMVLPFGNHAISTQNRDQNHDQSNFTGFASSAPAKPRIWLKLAITSGISFVLWLMVAVSADIWQAYFRDWARVVATG